MPQNPVAHPLLAPTITDTSITVDLMLDQPTRVTNYLADLTLERFLLDDLFDNAGGVTGGAVVYDVFGENELYLDRDVARVAPGGEFPVVTSSRRAPSVATVEKWGGKFYVTVEARDRNDVRAFQREAQKLGNNIVRKLNTRAVDILNAAIAANGGASTFVGNAWSTAIPNGSTPTPPADTPANDLAEAQYLANSRDLGIAFNRVLVNPLQLFHLQRFYGNALGDMLATFGYDGIRASNRVPQGEVYVYAQGQLGEMRLEQPLMTETWYENQTQRTWVQSSVRPVMYVTNPFAVIKITGIT